MHLNSLFYVWYCLFDGRNALLFFFPHLRFRPSYRSGLLNPN